MRGNRHGAGRRRTGPWRHCNAGFCRYKLIGNVVYLHAPDGIGRSKLAELIGKGWGATVTARNWRTAATVLALANELAAEAG